MDFLRVVSGYGSCDFCAATEDPKKAVTVQKYASGSDAAAIEKKMMKWISDCAQLVEPLGEVKKQASCYTQNA
ncbi:unnamed protein product [Symbiodinium natans]|uniref:Uncharacterized protein n=1 Tax=Symbiodinium natans TaxID=878477 RepID=A0A812R0N2_9DINO|nr:unnamed protein product [Symbiodinium natans]